MYLFKFNSEQLSWNGGISTADIKFTHKYLETICKKIPANMYSQLAKQKFQMKWIRQEKCQRITVNSFSFATQLASKRFRIK